MAVEITLSLVRKAHGNLNAEQLEKIELINLNGLGITHIDNLEVFDQIKELHLSNNKIQKIENLEFLSFLSFLDVSNNLIDSEGLGQLLSSKSLPLPKSLQTINLTGNPCCNDENLLIRLQDAFPHLGIIVGLYEEGEEEWGEERGVVSAGSCSSSKAQWRMMSLQNCRREE